MNILFNTVDLYGKNHMPFIFYNDNNCKQLLFDKSLGRAWKLHYYDGDNIYKIKTPSYNEICSECNGMIFKNDNKYYLTYTYNNFYHNYREIRYLSGFSMNDLTLIDTLHYEIGLVNKKYVCVGEIGYNILGNGITFYYNKDINKPSNSISDDNKIFSIKSSYHFAKMGFIFDNPDKIIVTYVPTQDVYNAEGSCIIDMNDQSIKEIKLKNSDAAYKASIDGRTGDLYYAKRLAGFEERNIIMVTKNEYELVNTEKIFIKN